MAANRDEFYSRPTLQANFWDDHTSLLGGRDLRAKGTWLVISKSGKLAALTNFRDPSNIITHAASRGNLPTGFVAGNESPKKFLQNAHTKTGRYNGYNLLVGDEKEMFHYSNYERKINPVAPGIHGLSNALLNTPWPKVERSKQKLNEAISSNFTHDDLLKMMRDEVPANDELLPNTGIRKELERKLSAICIRTEDYGTCCSTVITIGHDRQVEFTEQSHAVGGRKATKASRYRFKIRP